MILGKCETEDSWKCSNYILDEVIMKRDDYYSSPCKTIDYEGEVQTHLYLPQLMTIDVSNNVFHYLKQSLLSSQGK